MGTSQPASTHSGSQLSDTQSVSIGALPTNLVIIASRYCAHGVVEKSTLTPVFASNAAMWLFTVSTAADQIAKRTGSAASRRLARPSAVVATRPAAEALSKLRRLSELDRVTAVP